MDSFSKKKRSQIMSSVKSSNNKSTELKFIEILKHFKITGWRRNYRIKGRPDFVFLKDKTAIFIDGCFWHGCPKHCRLPKSNRKYWADKIDRNKARDKIIKKYLKNKEWNVLRFWEHELNVKKYQKIPKKLSFLKSFTTDYKQRILN